MWWFSKDGEQEKKSKDDDDSHPNVQQLTQLNWVDNVHWTCVGDDDSGDAGNDIDGVGDTDDDDDDDDDEDCDENDGDDDDDNDDDETNGDIMTLVMMIASHCNN